MKRSWLTLQERIDLGLHHILASCDWRPIARGTLLEGMSFCGQYMGERLVQTHNMPVVHEIPGRYLTALAVCLDANPTFTENGRSAADIASHLVRYLDRRTNGNGKMEVTQEEISKIDSPEHIFIDSLNQGKSPDIARRWWDGARGIIHEPHVLIALEGLVRWFLRTGDPEAEAVIKRMVAGRVSDPGSPEVREGRASVMPALMMPLAMYYEATGDEETKAYLDDVADYFFQERYFDFFPDGKHTDAHGVGHLHCRLHGLSGLMMYAKVTGRNDYMDAAEELFNLNTLYGTEFGWMPERHISVHDRVVHTGDIFQPWAVPGGFFINPHLYSRPRQGFDTCEICVSSDALNCAILLARSGRERYWDIAERFANHIFEAQIRDDSFIIERKHGDMQDRLCAEFNNGRDTLLGGYLSFSSPTWAVPRKQKAKMKSDGREGLCEGKYYNISICCCHGWGIRTLGILWQHIVTEDGDRVEVNFPFDRKTSKIEVKSELPFKGRVSVRAVAPVDLYVRIPDWAEHSTVELHVNQKRREKIEFKNIFSDYVKVGRLKPGDTAEVSYPLRREKKRYQIEYHPNLYEASWLGNYVMGMREIRVSEGQGTETFTGFGELYQY